MDIPDRPSSADPRPPGEVCGPVGADATCPATGAPIQVRLTADGVAQVQPADTVIAAVHPVELPTYDNLGNLRDVQVSLCDPNPFFSSARAAAGWLTQHPEGRLFSVPEFWEFSQHIWTSGYQRQP